jgi:hypothetical protein
VKFRRVIPQRAVLNGKPRTAKPGEVKLSVWKSIQQTVHIVLNWAGAVKLGLAIVGKSGK